MGINLNADFEFFVKGRKSFEEYSDKNILMLGKQTVNFKIGKLYETLSRAQFKYRKDVLDISDRDIATKSIDSYDLFKLLGFKEVHALDVSDYEAADIILDLACKELPSEYHGNFDYILDGGTLEHVFNLVQALINIHKMLKIGGTVVHVLPCEGWCDHGFYSFSPTSLIDFYTNNGYFVKQSFLFGYKYPDVDSPAIVSPDCRFMDCDKWIHLHRGDFRFNLIIAAEKLTDTDDVNLHFTQYHWERFFEKMDDNKRRYEYDTRLSLLDKAINEGKKIAVYGSGAAAMDIFVHLGGAADLVQGIYDPKKHTGDLIDFNVTKKKVLSINEILSDGIDCVFVASKKRDVIDIIRERIAHIKKSGIRII